MSHNVLVSFDTITKKEDEIMNKEEIKRVHEFIESQHYTAEVDDLDAPDEYTSPSQIIIHTTDAKNASFCYQTSNTTDCGAMSSQLALNDESGAIDALSSALIASNFSDDFVEENVYEIANIIAQKLNVQKIFDDYLNEIGSWERAPSSMDANSEVFVRTKL